MVKIPGKVVGVRIPEKLMNDIEKHRINETEFENLSDFIRALLRRELRRSKSGERRRVEDKLID